MDFYDSVCLPISYKEIRLENVFLKQAEKIATLVKAAKVSDVESYWYGLFAKLAEKRSIGDLILNVGAGGGAAVAAAAPAGGAAGGGAAAAAPPPEEKKVWNSQFRSYDRPMYSIFLQC